MKDREVKAMTEEEKAAYPSKQELYELCSKQGVPIVAMKPFAAGNILKNHEEGRLKGLLSLTPVQCISYVLSFPQVACLVPGFANVEELNQLLAHLTASEEEKDFSEIRESLVGQFTNQCMYCNHCQPCPRKIDIAEVTKLTDMAEKEMTDELRERYAALLVTGEDCVHCGGDSFCLYYRQRQKEKQFAGRLPEQCPVEFTDAQTAGNSSHDGALERNHSAKNTRIAELKWRRL